jgi:hypothetical protein
VQIAANYKAADRRGLQRCRPPQTTTLQIAVRPQEIRIAADYKSADRCEPKMQSAADSKDAERRGLQKMRSAADYKKAQITGARKMRIASQ